MGMDVFMSVQIAYMYMIVCRGDHFIHDDIRADFPRLYLVILKKPPCVRTKDYGVLYSRVVIVLQMYPYLLAYG